MNNSSCRTPIQSTEDSQTSILKEAKNNYTALSHVRHFNIPSELLGTMEEQRLESYLSKPEPDLTMYDD